MQILRCLSLACATAIISSPLLLRADNEAQIRAQQALDQKMQELNSQSVTSTPPSTVAKPVKPKPKPAPPAPVQKPTPPPVQPPVVSQSTPPTPPPPPQPKPAKKLKPASATSSEFAPAPTEPSANTQTDERLQNALQQKMTETPPPTEQQAPPPPRKHKEEVTESSTPPSNPTPPPSHTPPPTPPAQSLPPLQGPPSPLSASKQNRLEELLQLYKADQITPQQYHEQRAKILSEP